MSNAFETLARTRKVLAICARIPFGQTEEQIEATVIWAESLTEGERARFAQHAGQHPPSEATWALVVATLRARRVNPFARAARSA